MHRKKKPFVFEHHSEPLLSHPAFLLRVAKHTGIACIVVCGALGIGVLGYHNLEGISWLDALLNASMILGGMGPVNELRTSAGKLFASFYALFSGLVFLVIIGILFAPVIHRLIHKFHLELESDEEKENSSS